MKKLNKETCEIIGAFIGDGYMWSYGKNKNKAAVGFVGHKIDDEDYIKIYLKKIIIKNFPKSNPRIYYRTDEKTIRLIDYSGEIANFLKEMGFNPGKKTKTVKIPEIIIKNKNLVNFTLRGIYDTDGCVFFDQRKAYSKPYPRVVLESYSSSLITQIHNLLSDKFKIYLNKRKSRDGQIIEIYGHQQLEKFLKHIGFSNKKHISKCPCGLAVRALSR